MNELAGFQNIWKGGYYEGDVRSYVAPSSFKMYGFISVTRAVYLTCIRPYVRSDSVVLEIGPGRGAWTKPIADLNPRRLDAVDVVSPEHSRFWDNLGPRENVNYIQTDNRSLSEIDDGSVTYFFSFGVFCHLPPEMSEEYVNSLARKMKPGADGFLMIADFDKFNRCIANKEQTSLLAALSDRRFRWVQRALRLQLKLKPESIDFPVLEKRPEGEFPVFGGKKLSGRWFHWGVDRACAALEAAGFEIVERDMDQVPRDPIIHFRKPA
jgi:SAM-dependent methyltransferase